MLKVCSTRLKLPSGWQADFPDGVRLIGSTASMTRSTISPTTHASTKAQAMATTQPSLKSCKAARLASFQSCLSHRRHRHHDLVLENLDLFAGAASWTSSGAKDFVDEAAL